MTSRWLITGTSRGLGRALAQAALEAGHRVVATARDPSQLRHLEARHGEAVRVAALDVTDPGARAWFWSKHPPFFGNGLGGIWTDLGEPERHPVDMYHELGPALKVHNIYDLLWAETVFNGFNAFRPNTRLFNLTRSGFAGLQRYGTATWSGSSSASSANWFSPRLPGRAG